LKNRILAWPTTLVAALFSGIIGATCWIMLTDPKAVDFLSFWAAGKMVVDGAGDQIYLLEAHRAVERTAVATVGLLPFPYPPPFALFVSPFGLLPYGLAFTAWTVTFGTLYVCAARTWMPGRLALAQPAVLANGFIGQNAFLTSAVFLGGLRILGTRPMIGGAVLGLLVIKPQLALALPIAMLASRNWRAIAGGALSASGILLVGLAAFGPASYAAFFEMLSVYAGFVSAGRWPWKEIASIYAFLRYFGVAAAIAMAIHVSVAAIAGAMVWQSWRKGFAGKEAIAAGATLLIPPYLLTYDGVLLGLPVAWLLLTLSRPGVGALVWALSLLSVGSVAGFYDFPNALPLGALVSIVAIYASARDRIGPIDLQLEIPAAH